MANQKIIDNKSQIVDEITDVAKSSASFILFDYRGLTAEETTELRRLLRESDSSYKVWKNTLTKRALNSLEYNLDEALEGPSAIAFSSDAIAPIKALSNFAKEHPALEIRVGYIDSEFADSKVIAEYATIPSMEGLLTMFAGGLMEHVRNLSIGLNLYAEKLEEGGNN